VARVKLVAQESGAVKQMDLADPGDVDQRKKFPHLELGTSLFECFARRTLGHGFVQLHETRRQRPLAQAGFDVAFAQQHPLTEHRNGAHHIERIFVMHGLAVRADTALPGVAVVGHSVHHGGTAVATVFGGGSMHEVSVI